MFIELTDYDDKKSVIFNTNAIESISNCTGIIYSRDEENDIISVKINIKVMKFISGNSYVFINKKDIDKWGLNIYSIKYHDLEFDHMFTFNQFEDIIWAIRKDGESDEDYKFISRF